MECLHSRTRQLLGACVALNTASTYRTAVCSFNNFRLQYGFPVDYPGRADHFVMYISYCFEMGFSPSTIRSYISGLSFYHKLHNWFDPLELFVVKKLLEGYSRSRRRVDNRAPVTPQILHSICTLLPSICYNDYEAILFKAAYLLAYFGLLRVSEVVHSTWQHHGRALLLDDIKFDHSCAVVVAIRQSKTCQMGEPTYLRIPCEADSNMCPVCSLKKYLAVRPSTQGYFFKHKNDKPLTRAQFSAVLAKCISSSPYKGANLLSHSFRIGRASELASKGVPDEAIMKLGRWRSAAYSTYIRM